MPSSGRPVDAQRFDPQLASHVPHLPVLDFTDAARSRKEALERFRAGAPHVPQEAQLDIEDRLVPGLGVGDGQVSIRIYWPRRTRPLPAVLWIHGGSFVLGSVEVDHPRAASAAAELSAVVVSVDYRLAPEHPYPAAIDDCDAALRWLVHDAAQVSLDQVAVVGVSAGGALAAALALRMRDRGGPVFCLQALVMPMLDDRLATPSMREFTDRRIYNAGLVEAGWRHYLSAPGVKGDVPPDAAPGRATDLTGLPPTYICLAELDPLRDEGIEYAVRLTQAGVPVELHQFPGTFHGSQFSVQDAVVSRRMRSEMYAALVRSFAASP